MDLYPFGSPSGNSVPIARGMLNRSIKEIDCRSVQDLSLFHRFFEVSGCSEVLSLANSELEILRQALQEHVHALAVDIGRRTPSIPDSLVRAANYIHSVLEDAGLSVRGQNYPYQDQRVTNVLATTPRNIGASAYYVVGAHYDMVPSTPGADDNASAVAVMLELAGRLRQTRLKAPILFALMPSLDVKETDKEIVVEAELPGL